MARIQIDAIVSPAHEGPPALRYGEATNEEKFSPVQLMTTHVRATVSRSGEYTRVRTVMLVAPGGLQTQETGEPNRDECFVQSPLTRDEIALLALEAKGRPSTRLSEVRPVADPVTFVAVTVPAATAPVMAPRRKSMSAGAGV